MIKRSLFVVLVGFALLASEPVRASTPDSLEVTCDVDRTAFRNLASSASSVTFKLWNAVSGGTQCGGSHVVPMGKILALRPKGDKFDGQRPRKFLELRAVLGTDGASGTPVDLCAGDESWLEIEVAGTPLTCDFSSDPNSKQDVPLPNPDPILDAPARRRLSSVAFAQESSHSETCDVCSTAPAPDDVSVRVYFSPNAVYFPSGGETAVNWNEELWDTAGFHDNAVNNSRLTVPSGQGGTYLIFCHTEWDAQTGGVRTVRLRSTRFTGGQVAPSVGGFTNAYNSVSTVYRLDPGDYVECLAGHNFGAPLALGGSDQQSAFGMIKLR